MVVPIAEKTRRLQHEISVLSEEAAALLDKLPSVTGFDELRLKHQVHEVRQTISSKAWALAELQLQEEGALRTSTTSYYLDQENPDYLVKVWEQQGQVVATETIASNMRAGGYCSLYIWGVRDAPNLEWEQLKTVLQPIGRDMWAAMLTQVLTNWTGIQWRYADLRSGTWVFQSVFENHEKIWRTVKPEGYHGLSDEVTLKQRPRRLSPFTQCRVCQCTNDNCSQCVAATGQPCHWAAPYLCSRCYAEQQGGGASR